MQGFSRAAPAAPTNVYSNTLTLFATCRKPWNEYIQLITKMDSEPYPTRLYDKPMYRGRKRGKEGWLFGQQVQLHYRYYPDEHIIKQLPRWRSGQTIGDVALQQFRGAQPHKLERDDPQGFQRPPPETYMKLNYKNPATFSAFLTQTGHMYPMDILPMHPEAVLRVRYAKQSAIRIGLYPRFGNPFWHRTQKHRPKPDADQYDPTTHDTKKTMEHFAFNWLQLQRIKLYFQAVDDPKSTLLRSSEKAPPKSAEALQQDGWYSNERGSVGSPPWAPYDNAGIAYSSKNPTVPGLMSVSGMKKRFHNLYSDSGVSKRMGFPNPVMGIKKI